MKFRWQSKTLWFNVLTAIAAGAGAIPETSVTLYVVLAANVLLRALTTSPLIVLKDAADATDTPAAPKA